MANTNQRIVGLQNNILQWVDVVEWASDSYFKQIMKNSSAKFSVH